MAENNKEPKDEPHSHESHHEDDQNHHNKHSETDSNHQNQHKEDVHMTDTNTKTSKKDKKDSKPDSKQDIKKGQKGQKKDRPSSRRSRDRDNGTYNRPARHRDHDRYRNPSRSNSRSRSDSNSRSRHRPRRSHRHRSPSPTYHRDRNHRRRDRPDRDRRRPRHHHSSYRERSKDKDKDSAKEIKNPRKSASPTSNTNDNNNSINVTVFPKSTPGESRVIKLDVSRTITVSDFKGSLCARGFNVFLQYDLYVNDKELDVEDDRLLCVHVGIKSDANIMVKPKADNDPTKKNLPDQYDPFLASNDVQVTKEDKEKNLADQIEMYKAYEEMFGVEEAAGMMNLDPEEVKKVGIEAIFERLEREKERKRQDREAAEAARSTSMNGLSADMMSAQNYYSEEMLFAQAMQAAAFNNAEAKLPINPTVAAAMSTGTTYNGVPTNENLIDFDTAPGTTHTAGGGTVSRPPPTHVSENACIFVGDLHPMVTRSDLLSVFSQIGQVQWIQLFDCHKQMNRPFNFAFVYFEDLLCARNAITTLNYTKFYGSPCRLMWKQEKNSVQWTDCNIIVKNLPPNTDSQLLHAVFSKFGKILSSKVKTTATGRNLPYGYVQYGTKDSADKAIVASDRGQLSVNGHLLTAEWFKSREDRAFRQIYVKNIPSSWSDEELLQLFEAQTKGKIKSFTVKHSPYGRWACISFHEPHHAVKAIENLNNCPTGDPVCPNLNVSRFMYKTERDKFKTVKTQNVDQCYSIYVGNVPLQLTDEHMRQLFEPFGAVISAAVVQKTEDYKYGFVNFEQPEDAARALVTMNGKTIGNKTIQVKPANTDMSKAIAITRAADYVHHNPQQSVMQTQQQEPMSAEQAKDILRVDGGKREKVWKVQYGEDWHEYDTTLAAIVEQLNIGEQIQITLADSNYIITRMQETEAMQKNCASGTMRKVVRTVRDLE